MIRLFTFPYAGGSGSVYHRWRNYLNPGIELIPIDYAGRGKRMADPPEGDIAEMVEYIFRQIQSLGDNVPYAFFGHSLGSIVAYVLAQRIRQENVLQPCHIFFSGQGAPHVREPRKYYHLMGDEEFKMEIRDLGGTPPEFFQYQELMDLFLPVLRNDFRIAETPYHPENIEPLDLPLSILLGKQDDFTAAQCDGWKLHTSQRCTMHHFNGGHFFLHDHTQDIVGLINQVLMDMHQPLPSRLSLVDRNL